MIRRLSRGFARARAALDPLACLLALTLWVAAVVLLVRYVNGPPDDAWILLVPAGAGLLGLTIGADRFSWNTLALGLLVLAGIWVASLASLGLAQDAEDRLEGFRGAATAANVELTELETRPPPSRSLADATEALDAAREALVAPVSGFDANAQALADSALAATSAAVDAGDAQDASIDEATQTIEELASSLADEPPQAATRAVAALQAALDATRSALELDQAERQLADLAEARVRVDALCRGAGATFGDSGAPDTATVCRALLADEGPADPPEPERLLAVRRAQAELAVADASVAFAADDDAKEAAATRVLERSQALTEALAAAEQPPPSTSVADAVGLGASAVVTDVVGESTEVPLALELLGWVLVGVAALWIVRSLSTRNADRELGPVALTAPKEAGAEAEQFRTYLLRNLPEPGAVPGADAISEVSSLVVALEPVVKLPTASALVAAVKTAVVVERGYNVEYCDLPSNPPATGSGANSSTGADAKPAASSGSVELVVRVRHARTTELLAQRIVRRPQRHEALREGAYWAAAVIINASKVVPQWARWDPESAGALATFNQEEDLGKLALDDLRLAARLAPTSGVLGMRLAHAEAVKGNQLEAFAQVLQTVRQHPRYLLARYRLAVSASLLADDAQLLANASRDLRLRLAGDLELVGGASALAAKLRGTPTSVANADELAIDLCSFSLTQLSTARRNLWTPYVLWNWLRTGERVEQRRFIPFRQSRRDVKQIGASCRYAVKERRRQRGGKGDALRVSKKAHRSGSWLLERGPIWQVAYNLACFHSLASQSSEHDQQARKDDAFRLLEAARRSRDSQQLSLDWLQADSDLQPLRGDSRWKEFLARIAPTEVPTP